MMNDKLDRVYNLRGDDYRLREILGAALDLAALCVFMVLFLIATLCL